MLPAHSKATYADCHILGFFAAGESCEMMLGSCVIFLQSYIFAL